MLEGLQTPEGTEEQEEVIEWGEGTKGVETPEGTEPEWGTEQPDEWNDQSEYADLIREFGQSHLDKMYEDFEKVNEVLNDEAQLESMKKEDLIRLYQTRDALQWDLDRITPLLNQGRDQKMISYVDSIEDEKARDFVSELIEDFDTAEEAETLVALVKDIASLYRDSTSEDGTPADIKNSVKGGKSDTGGNEVDAVQGMFDLDPEVRKKARASMDKLLSGLNYG